MNNKKTKYKKATELLPLILECNGEHMYDDGYEADNISDFNELRADANWHLAKLFTNNILKIEDDLDMTISIAVNDLLYSGGKSFQDIKKIIRKQFNIKK